MTCESLSFLIKGKHTWPGWFLQKVVWAVWGITFMTVYTVWPSLIRALTSDFRKRMGPRLRKLASWPEARSRNLGPVVSRTSVYISGKNAIRITHIPRILEKTPHLPKCDFLATFLLQLYRFQ